jgi:protein O-mannosyl-transferase
VSLRRIRANQALPEVDYFRPQRQHLTAFLITASAAVVLYLAFSFPGHQHVLDIRGYSIYQRLATQPFALFTYISNSLFPMASNISIFRDDFAVVKGLLENPIWMLLVAAFGAIAGIGFWLRKRQKNIAFAIFGFFSVHSLEASIIPLEVYFEHRNYLGLAFIVGLVVAILSAILKNFGARLFAPLFLAVFLLFGFITYTVSIPWGDPTLAAITWSAERPNSVRAQQFAVDVWGGQGQLMEAERIAREGFERSPRYPVLMLQSIQMKCARGENVSDDMIKGFLSIAKGSVVVDQSTFDTIQRLYELGWEGRCKGLEPDLIIVLVDVMHAHARVGMHDALRAQGWFVKAKALHDFGDLGAAVESLERSYAYSHDPGIRLWQALWSLAAGDPAAARNFFQMYEAQQEQRFPSPQRHLRPDRSESYDLIGRLLEELGV